MKAGRCRAALFFYKKPYSAIAQLVERTTVNRVVAGSSPACGVFLYLHLISKEKEDPSLSILERINSGLLAETYFCS